MRRARARRNVFAVWADRHVRPCVKSPLVALDRLLLDYAISSVAQLM